MPLIDSKTGEMVITAHASKKSKVNLFITEAHTSVLMPLFILPLTGFAAWKLCFGMIFVLILLERRGWTLGIAVRRIRSRVAGRYRYRKTYRDLVRRIKLS